MKKLPPIDERDIPDRVSGPQVMGLHDLVTLPRGVAVMAAMSEHGDKGERPFTEAALRKAAHLDNWKSAERLAQTLALWGLVEITSFNEPRNRSTYVVNDVQHD